MALVQELPSDAVAHYERTLGLEAEAVALMRSLWGRVDRSRIVDSWADLVEAHAVDVEALQFRAAFEGASYAGRTLAGGSGYVEPDVFPDPSGFTGFSPEYGTPNTVALADPAYRALDYIGDGMSVDEALSKGGKKLDMLAMTLVADTARASAAVDVSARPRVGYVRMVNPPSCRDCLILAGKFFRHNQGFLRHPNCDCVHVPSTESVAEGMVADPYEAFDSMSEADQDRVFGRREAQAIRDGADIFQVVNAERRLARKGNARGWFTLEGTSKRGNARRTLKAGQRRLTPRGVYEQAEQFGMGREWTLRTLEEHGYVLPGGRNPHGAIVGQRWSEKTTMTAAEKRYQDAVRNWEEVQRGLNPYSSAAPVRRRIERGDNVRQWAVDTPLTDFERARAEAEYYAVLVTRGESFTKSGQSLASARALNKAYYRDAYGL